MEPELSATNTRSARHTDPQAGGGLGAGGGVGTGVVVGAGVGGGV